MKAMKMTSFSLSGRTDPEGVNRTENKIKFLLFKILD